MAKRREFGALLLDIMRREKCSAVELAKKLGYKSHTSVVRIINGQVGCKTRDEFYKRLSLANVLSLTPKDQEALALALDESRYDEATLDGREMLWQYLFSSVPPQAPAFASMYQEGGPVFRLTPEEWAEELQNVKAIQVDIFDCCDPAFFTFLRNVLLPLEPRCQIRHYIPLQQDASKVIQAMICAAMMVRFRGYNGMYCPSPAGEGASFAALSGKAYIWYETESGWALTLLYAGAGDRYFAYTFADASQHRLLINEMTLGMEERFIKMRGDYSHPDKEENLLLLVQRLLFMERNRATRMYRPALCYNHLATELLVDSVTRMVGEDVDPAILDALRQTHDARYENAFHMKAPTWLALMVDGMWEVARTGILPEQVDGLSPLTPQARLFAFQNLLDASRENPRLHFYFLHEDVALQNLMISSYEGLGVYILDPTTGLDSRKGLFEAILPLEAFVQAYDDFFDQELIAKNAYSQAQSRQILQTMVDWLKKGIADGTL